MQEMRDVSHLRRILWFIANIRRFSWKIACPGV